MTEVFLSIHFYEFNSIPLNSILELRSLERNLPSCVNTSKTYSQLHELVHIRNQRGVRVYLIDILDKLFPIILFHRIVESLRSREEHVV
jgi:hypothetical protein